MKIFFHNYSWMFLAVVLTIISYFPTFNCGFTNWDDDYFVINNSLIQSFSLQNIKVWFTKPFMGLYQPLVLFSLALDFSFDGLNPLVFHSTNLILHLINLLLVFQFVNKLFEKRDIAIVSMLLFGLHSIHVESVAWITERKDLLFSLFYLISLNIYLSFILKRNAKKYFALLAVFGLALLSKAMAVSLPLVLLLIDFYKNRNLLSSKVILEKIPLFVIAILWGILTIYWHNQSGSLDNATGFGYAERFFLAFKGLAFYISRILFPVNLAAFHPLPAQFLSLLWVEIFVYLVIFISFSTWLFFKRNKYKKLFFGYWFFILTIFLLLIPPGVPVIASERYAYIPSIGIIILVASGFHFIINMSSKLKLITQLCLSVYILFLGITTFNQTKTWNNSLTLWNNVMDIHGEFFFPLQQRGIAHRLVKNYEAAIDDFETAISYKPDYYRTYEQRGYVYSLTSDFQKAEKDFQKAVELHPESYTAWSNLGFIYRQTENYEKSMDCLNNAINYNSTYVDAYINRAETLKSIGKHNEACNDLTIAKSKIPTKLQIKKITKLINEIGCNQ